MAVAAAASACGGHAAAKMDGVYDVRVALESGEPFCAGSMQLASDPGKAGDSASGGADLCTSNSAFSGRVTVVQLAEGARVAFAFPSGAVALQEVAIDPMSIFGMLPSSAGKLQLTAIRRGARLGKSLGPPMPDTPVGNY